MSSKPFRRNLSEGGYPGWSPYAYTLCNPLKYKDPDGRFPWGAIIGAGVELASQVASDIIINNSSFVKAFENVDWADVATAATVGFATGGLSSLKTVGTLGKIGINIAGSVTEGAIKANVGSKTYNYSVENATTDALIGGVSSIFGEVGKKVAQSTERAKGLNKIAKRLSNIAETGRARPAQALRATKAAKAAASYGSGPAAETINEIISTTIQEIFDKEEENSN